MAEIVEVVRLIPQACSSEHRGADCPRPRTTDRGRNSGSDPDYSQERISKRIQRKNEDQLLPEGEPVRILGNTSTEGVGEENIQNSLQEREPRYKLCDIEYTSKDAVRRRSSRQSESTNRSSMCQCHYRFLEEIVSMMKMAPHEHVQTSHERTATVHQQGS